MTAKRLSADDVGLPQYSRAEPTDGDIFDLSSHQRAREALEFGLSVKDTGFHVFVLGADGSGRMTATRSFLTQAIKDWPRPPDWVYLNNFQETHRPLPMRLPTGAGRRLASAIDSLIPRLRDSLSKAFSNQDYERQVAERNELMQQQIGQQFESLRAQARQHGMDLLQTPQGLQVVAVDQEGKPVSPDQLSSEQRDRLEASSGDIRNALRQINRVATEQQVAFTEWVANFNRDVAEGAIGDQMQEFIDRFSDCPDLGDWLEAMRKDILENVVAFRLNPGEPLPPGIEPPERRYAVNLLVDHSASEAPAVVVEANPTAQSMFGTIEYRQAGGILETDFSLIRPGAMHRANGGILVLRADALAANAMIWQHLKGALRDREINLAEIHRTGAIPIAGAPNPHPIPLDIKVVIVGAPQWYYAFFSIDPEFQTYFGIKADIDTDMEATPDNIASYSGLVQQMAKRTGDTECTSDAIGRLLSIASRWAGHREKLSARFEMLESTIAEAAQLRSQGEGDQITEQDIIEALENRRRRNSRVEDRMHESITDGTVMIETTGSAVGQINALTVRDLGDHAFGGPSRVTARASIGRHGVLNIERVTALGGPIQQKGVLVLQGFLSGLFARRFPLSFNCSITFEQNYGGVDGDSASLAELLAIISDLSRVPLRQDVAITGSVNQQGESQAIGGAHHKIEGFFRACIDRGELTGTQGVVLPLSNEENLVLRDDVRDAIAAQKFHVWSVKTVSEAIELYTGMPAGETDERGIFPDDTVFGKVQRVLETYDQALALRDIPAT